MNIQIAALCDAATDYGGKLNLLGTFDTILTPSLPATHPAASVALRIVFEKIEEGPHRLRIGFVNDDGRPVMPGIEIPLEVEVPAEASFVSRNIVVNIQALKFDVEGNYSIDIAIDGRHECSIPLAVKKMEPPQLGLPPESYPPTSR